MIKIGKPESLHLCVPLLLCVFGSRSTEQVQRKLVLISNPTLQWMHEKATVSITKNKNKFGTKVHDTQNSTIATEAHQLYVAPNTTMLHKMVVRKTSETHKPTNKKDAFSRNNDTAKANYSFYTRTQHLTGAHYSRLQHSIDSCRTIMMSNSLIKIFPVTVSYAAKKELYLAYLA